MRLLISIMAVVLLALILLAACNSSEHTPVKNCEPSRKCSRARTAARR